MSAAVAHNPGRTHLDRAVAVREGIALVSWRRRHRDSSTDREASAEVEWMAPRKETDMTDQKFRAGRAYAPPLTTLEQTLLTLADACQHAAVRRIEHRWVLAERILRDIGPAERRRERIVDMYRGGVRP